MFSSPIQPNAANRLILLGILFAAGFGCVASISPAPPPPGDESRPNIVFVLTDDMDARSIAHMPRTKALLADRGTTFSRMYVTQSLCCPSRSSILRGQYPHSHQITGNKMPEGGFEKFHNLGREQSTIATWLKAGGYRTGFMGKYLNGYPGDQGDSYVPPGWDEWNSPVGGTPYGNFNYQMNENGRTVAYGSASADYMTDVLARKSTAFIQRSTTDRRPFFLYLATYAPHGPATPAPRHAGQFASAALPRRPSFNETDVSDKPTWVQELSPINSRAVDRFTSLYRKRLESLQAVDEMVAGIVDALTAAGKLDNTFIVFTSDNGFHMGEHRLSGGKNTAYEEDILIPLIVRGPGVPAGRTVDDIVLNNDFAPTFAELGQVVAPSWVDGRSFVPLLRGSAPATWRQSLLVQHPAADDLDGDDAQAVRTQRQIRRGRQARVRLSAAGIPGFFALRTRTHLYVEYEGGEKELYDLRADPYELTNLAPGASASVLQTLSIRLRALRLCSGAGCRAAEDETVSIGK